MGRFSRYEVAFGCVMLCYVDGDLWSIGDMYPAAPVFALYLILTCHATLIFL